MGNAAMIILVFVLAFALGWLISWRYALWFLLRACERYPYYHCIRYRHTYLAVYEPDAFGPGAVDAQVKAKPRG